MTGSEGVSLESSTFIEGDKLDRKGFARIVANTLLSHKGDEALIVGISGTWGSGKTYVAEMVRELASPAAKVITFRPWLVTTKELLIMEFFREIGVAISASVDATAATEVRQQVYKLGASISGVIATAGPYLLSLGAASGLISPDAALVGTGAVKGASDIGKLLETAKESLASEVDQQSVSELRSSVIDKCKALTQPVVIVIEDLDRLHKSELQLMFQLIKSVADFPRVSYLLLYDRDQIIHALKDEVNDVDLYLQKIVQLPLDLPKMDEEGVANLRTRLDELVAREESKPGEGSYFVENFLLTAFDSPREVKRFTDTALLLYESLLYDGHSSVNALDFLCLEYLRQFFPDCYAFLRRLASTKTLDYLNPAATNVTEWRGRLSVYVQAQPELSRARIATMLQRLGPDEIEPHTDDILESKRFWCGYWQPVYFGFSPARASVAEHDWQVFASCDYSFDELTKRLVSDKSANWVEAIANRSAHLKNGKGRFVAVNLLKWAENAIQNEDFSTVWAPREFVGTISQMVKKILGATLEDWDLADAMEGLANSGECTLMLGALMGRDPSNSWFEGGNRSHIVSVLRPRIEEVFSSSQWMNLRWIGAGRSAFAAFDGEAHKSWFQKSLANPEILSVLLNKGVLEASKNSVGVKTFELHVMEAVAQVPDDLLDSTGLVEKRAIIGGFGIIGRP